MKKRFKFSVYLSIVLAISSARAGAYVDFFRAIGADDGRAVATLLARGFDPNSPDEHGQVGLFLALRDDAPKVADALLASPATRIDEPNGVGETPLMMAALRGRLDAARRLVERGAQVNRDGWTPLHYAATGPEPRLVSLMLEQGARIDAPSPNHSTPLMMAARYGPEASVDILLAHGADPKPRNDKALNAADFARQAGREALAVRLERLKD